MCVYQTINVSDIVTKKNGLLLTIKKNTDNTL